MDADEYFSHLSKKRKAIARLDDGITPDGITPHLGSGDWFWNEKFQADLIKDGNVIDWLFKKKAPKKRAPND